MRIKIVSTNELIAFTKQPVFNYSLAASGSTLQVEIGGDFAFTDDSGTCFTTNQSTRSGYSFNSLASPLEVIAETNQGERLFRGFFDEYTTRYDSTNKDNTTTTLIFNDCSRFLNRGILTGSYRNLFQAVLEEIVSVSHVDGIITPIIYKTSTTRALKAVKQINFISPPVLGDIVIVGQKKYKYVIEAPTNDMELNIETDIGLMVNELVSKINSSSASECTANENGNSILLTGIDFNNNFLVYTDGTRITTQVIQDASASDPSGIVTSILDLHVNIDFEEENLRQCLEKLCSRAFCNFYVDPRFGNLIIYQPEYYLDRLDSLRTINASRGKIVCTDDPSGIIKNLSYRESGSIVNKVIVWGKNGEVPLPELRLEDQHITITTIDKSNQDIPINSEVVDYFYNQNAIRVLQVKITPKEPIIPPGMDCSVTYGFGGTLVDLINSQVALRDIVIGTPTYSGLALTGSTTETRTIIRNWLISSPGEHASLSYIYTFNTNITDANLLIKIGGMEIINETLLESNQNIGFNISLSALTGNDILVEVIFSLPIQATDGEELITHASISCCQVEVVAGGKDNFDIDGNALFGNNIDARNAGVNVVVGLAVDSDNNLYIASEDEANNLGYRIKKVRAIDNVITDFVGTERVSTGGTGIYPPVHNGNPLDYYFRFIGTIAYYQGYIYFTESFPPKVLRVPVDGSVLEIIYEEPDTSLSFYTGITVDSLGNLYFIDGDRFVVWRLNVGETTPTVYVGTLDSGGTYSGEGGLATSATISVDFPACLVFDSQDNLYIQGDIASILKIDRQSGNISTVVGNPSAEYDGDYRDALQTYIGFPYSIGIHPMDDSIVFLSDYNLVRKVNKTTNTISTIAGNLLIPNDYSFTGNPVDGIIYNGSGYIDGKFASTFTPFDNRTSSNLVFDSFYSMYFSDSRTAPSGNRVVRKMICNNNAFTSGDNCFHPEWTRTGIFQEYEPNLGSHRKGFYIAAADITETAVGTFSTTVTLPGDSSATPNDDYILYVFVKYDVFPSISSPIAMGQVDFYVNGDIVTNVSLDKNKRSSLSSGILLGSFGGASNTKEISLEYNPDGDLPLAATTEGGFTFYPITICTRRSANGTSVNGVYNFESAPMTGSGFINFENDVVLVNPENGNPETFVAIVEIIGTSGSNAAIDVLINDVIQGNFLATSDPLTTTYSTLVPIDPLLAGENVNIKVVSPVGVGDLGGRYISLKLYYG